MSRDKKQFQDARMQGCKDAGVVHYDTLTRHATRQYLKN